VRRLKIAPHNQFFALFAYWPAAVVMLWHFLQIPLIPQPNRYELEMDLALPLALVFAGAALVDRLGPRLRTAVMIAAAAGLCAQTVHSALYAQRQIRSIDPAALSEYRVARWFDQNRPGERAFISGSGAYLYNAFTDNPQLEGGHDQHTVNPFLPVVRFTIHTGMNAGDRDAEYSIFWLKAFGTHLISVPGPQSGDYYKPVVHPRKFDGVLPLLWRDHDDSIYEVPGRSWSLAHVIPASAAVQWTPVHGLDIAPVERYVAALDDPRYPPASFQWQGLSDARIRATVEPGEVIAVQVTYAPGWEAWANGRRQRVRGDGIGQLIVEPDCTGACEIVLNYTGGAEHVLTRALSLAAMLLAAVYAWRTRRRGKPFKPPAA
jgi:hypothetical protein